jgi:hypothetical protein
MMRLAPDANMLFVLCRDQALSSGDSFGDGIVPKVGCPRHSLQSCPHVTMTHVRLTASSNSAPSGPL